MLATVSAVERRSLRVHGVVQGVGFRPFVHRLATSLGVGGSVGNDAAGVVIEVVGPAHVLDEFERRLVADAPRLAVVVGVDVLGVAGVADVAGGFRIVPSGGGGEGTRTALPADVATCDACLAELADPADRRYRYPFVNCTECGPRLTIIRDLPYDRAATTMAGFPLCAACRAEYENPADRRYHAEPVACPACGPRLRLLAPDGTVLAEGTDACLARVQHALAGGAVVAVKGVGGYHLACAAADDRAVGLLRTRKGRAGKPFAVMVRDLEVARAVAVVDDVAAAALQSPAAPIVLMGRRSPAGPVSPLVAPGNPLLGVMLPYSPLHHLLFAPVPGQGGDAPPAMPPALVMTSANLTDEPICHRDTDLPRLAVLADLVLSHDRPIEVPVDDSVVRVVSGVVQPVRRSRGYAPLPVNLPVEVAPVLAVGGELKNTCAVATGRVAWVGQHVGDMEHLATLEAFERTAGNLQRMYQVNPAVVGVDAHPRYLTRRWAVDHHRDRVVEVQHHHAHVAAVMAEHGVERAIGVAFDGTGYGVADDGAPELWGGEVLVAGFDGFVRAAHLRPFPLPGGDEGVRNPCRAAVAALLAAGEVPEGLPCAEACDPVELGVVRRQMERDVGCTPTTSVGRLFDVVASLLGVRHRISYEAQAAIELEALAATAAATRPGAVAGSLRFGMEGAVIDQVPVLRALTAAVRRGEPPAELAAGFHRAVAVAIADVVTSLVSADPALAALPVALTGGVFQNALLTTMAVELLAADGRTVLTHRVVPANDGGIALGQAVVAGVARRRHDTAIEGSR